MGIHRLMMVVCHTPVNGDDERNGKICSTFQINAICKKVFCVNEWEGTKCQHTENVIGLFSDPI